MQLFEEDRRRAEQRRYLAGLRISYGNAISDCNKRILQAASSSARPQPGNQNRTRSVASTRAPPPVRLATSNAYSWQLGTPLSPDRREASPAVPKEHPVVRQYEMLQKRALASSLLAQCLRDANTANK